MRRPEISVAAAGGRRREGLPRTRSECPGSESSNVPSRSKIRLRAGGSRVSVLRPLSSETSMFAASSSGSRNGYMSSRLGVWILPSGKDARAEPRLELLSHVEDRRRRGRAGLRQLCWTISRSSMLLNRERRNSVGRADFDHVGESDAAGGSGADEASLKEAGLGLTDGEVSAVVQDEDL